MGWNLAFSKRATKQLFKLDPQQHQRILKKIGSCLKNMATQGFLVRLWTGINPNFGAIVWVTIAFCAK